VIAIHDLYLFWMILEILFPLFITNIYFSQEQMNNTHFSQGITIFPCRQILEKDILVGDGAIIEN